MDWNEYIDNLLDVLHSIESRKITILTGGNGRGKSLIRKQMVFRVKEMFNLSDAQMKHSVKAVTYGTASRLRCVVNCDAR